MIGKYKVAHLLGITREHKEQFSHVAAELTKMGYICLSPAIYDVEVIKQHLGMLNDMCYLKLLICDFCVIATPDHIGESTKERIKQAKEMEKPVYIWQNEELRPYAI